MSSIKIIKKLRFLFLAFLLSLGNPCYAMNCDVGDFGSGIDSKWLGVAAAGIGVGAVGMLLADMLFNRNDSENKNNGGDADPVIRP